MSQVILSAEINIEIVYLLFSVVKKDKFLDFISIDTCLWIYCDIRVKNLVILYKMITDTGMNINNATEILDAFPIDDLSMLFTLLMRYFYNDKDVKKDFEERRKVELLKKRKTDTFSSTQNIIGNFDNFYNIISQAQQHYFCETSEMTFGKRRNEDNTIDLLCGTFTEDPLFTLNLKIEKTKTKLLRDNELKKKIQEEQSKTEEEFVKALEDAKPIKVSKQEQTKQANKKQQQAKKEREEYEKRCIEAEAERQRQQRKKQQQKQAKKKA
jgi:hypothetical protein